jgi:predicted TIM-barrel fold metal-dependent hydrolase
LVGSQLVLDAAAHPVDARDELRSYMPAPWAERAFPGPERYQYASTLGEYAPDTAPEEGVPGSDAALLGRQLQQAGVDHVVLLPLTRGLLANADLASVVAAATNRWLAERWLDGHDEQRPFLGTIRVNPADPAQAVAEIETWAEQPTMVQVAVPAQSHHPYGQRLYLPIWEAAAAHGLPVAIHTDGGASVDFPPTSAGYPRYALEYRTLYPLNVAHHLASFVAEGVFERLPELRVVCADGGFAAFTTLLWRLDKDWRSTREEIPWVRHLPSAYIARQVRFCLHAADLPPRDVPAQAWLDVFDPGGICMYASDYPQSDFLRPDEAAFGLSEEDAARLLWGTAAELYRIQPTNGEGSPA